jgi:hypothetical protein
MASGSSGYANINKTRAGKGAPSKAKQRAPKYDFTKGKAGDFGAPF